MIDRRLLQHFDWGLLFVLCLICLVGLVSLYSAVAAGDPGSPDRPLYFRQIIWYGIGAVMMCVCFMVDFRVLERWSGTVYASAVILLICVLLFGRMGGGARRWLALGRLTFQPSEFAKIAVIMMLSRSYAKLVSEEGLRLWDLRGPLLVLGVPFLLIVRQPDLGTALVMALIAGAMTVFAKIERRTFLVLTSGCCGIAAVGFFFLKEYQRRRIAVFLNPEQDPLGAGYHIIQSQIAIGSGMLSGKGMGKGTQNVLSFLPEQHTDFIFSVVAEEWGFIGAAGVHLLFFILVIWGLTIAYRCRHPYGIILAVGVTAMIFWQALINLGMVMGLLPVVGVPLPFISYGGSSVLTIMMCGGLLLNISMRRFSP